MDQARLTIYTTKWCGDCFRTKRFLDKHGIGYDQIDITDDEKARRHVQEIKRWLQQRAHDRLPQLQGGRRAQ